MKKVILLTYRNNLYRDVLEEAGYTIMEYNLPVSKNDLQEIRDIPSCSFSIVEVDENTILKSTEIFDALSVKGRVICSVDKMTDPIKNVLLEKGVSDVVNPEKERELVSYVTTIDKTDKRSSGRILILDDNGVIKRILENLICRFNYKPVFVDSIDDLFNNILKIKPKFILINLGAEKVDLNVLVKRSYSNSDIKKIPVLAYKDMEDGLFVHEVLTGLNKLTRFILSLDELYSFLVDLLFKKEIVPLIATFNKFINLENFAYCVDETLGKIFFLDEKKIFDSENILNEENFNEMVGRIELIKKTLVKTEGIKWLRMDWDRKMVNTLGMGV